MVDPRKVASNNLDACEKLDQEITGMVFRKEWCFVGIYKKSHYQTLILQLEKWTREGKTNYQDGLAYELMVHAFAAYMRFRSLRDGKYEEDLHPLSPRQRDQYSKRTPKTLRCPIL